ncbi:MAG: T9SS type A sorting domain-containing protein [Bacteroidales bacterium]|nr:T9SS type A sorting domain-containing protein [Bacteroidales bacterium]
MKKAVLFCSFSLSIWGIYAQIESGGVPYSFVNQSITDKTPTEQLSLPILGLHSDNEAILSKEDGYKFGDEIAVDFGLTNSGIWEMLPSGDRLWRLHFRSEGAKSLNLLFDDFYIPPHSKMFIYTADKSFVKGAFTAKNNNQWNNFATAFFPNDELIIEYQEDKSDIGQGRIHLNGVVHSYEDFFKKGTYGKASGNCHININCTGYEEYQNVKNAVALILFRSSAYCTGTLINNTAQNAKPYFLTANHCTSGRNLSQFVFVFNYESEDCEGNDETTFYSINGAKLLASDPRSDFALLLLNDTIAYENKPYYAGWSRENVPPLLPVGIHHPHGDLKKIAVAYPANHSQYDATISIGTHWAVLWERGTTESGSSGSALFNENFLVVGQLEGGYASCAENDTDFYGKIYYSWTNDNSPDSNRLDYWLDPLGTGALQCSGYDPCKCSILPNNPLKESLTLAPNPAKDYVGVFSENELITSISIYSLAGQRILYKKGEQERIFLNVNSLADGAYFVEVELKTGKIAHKLLFVKNR